MTTPRRAGRCLVLTLGVLVVFVAAMPRQLLGYLVDATANAVAAWGDDGALLVLVRDERRDGPWSALRSEEPRADVALVVRWSNACDRLDAVLLPRDTVLPPHAEPAAVAYGTGGPDAVVEAVEAVSRTDVMATLELDLHDVARLTRIVGPIELELARASRDRMTGFEGGPGPATLEGEAAVAFLRSRHWEEQRSDGAWVAVSNDDVERGRRQQRYVEGLAQRLMEAPLAVHMRFVASVLRHGDIDVRNIRAFTGFVVAVQRTSEFSVRQLATRPERDRVSRESPFGPPHLGAAHRRLAGAWPQVACAS